MYLPVALLALALVLTLGPAQMPYLALLRRGDELAARLERTAAASAYGESSSYRPLVADPYLRLAGLYLDWGRTEEALDALDRAEALGAASEEVARTRIAVFTALADWAAVAGEAQELPEPVPGDPEARHALAQAYVWLGRWEAAQAEYDALLYMNPADNLAHERLGMLLAGWGRHREAAGPWREFLRLYPDHPKAQHVMTELSLWQAAGRL